MLCVFVHWFISGFWYPTEAGCQAALKGGVQCMPCDGGCAACVDNLGCPTFECPSCYPAKPLNITSVTFTDLKSAAVVARGESESGDGMTRTRIAGSAIPASALRCMNTEGVDFWGRHYSVSTVAVPPGEVLPLWVAAVIPPTVASGLYTGFATVTTSTITSTVKINLTVSGAFLPNGTRTSQ